MKQIIIDVREPEEFASGHVHGAINIPPQNLLNGATELGDIPKNTRLVVYCRTGSRSAVAANVLQSLGYTNIVNGINKDQVVTKYL